jgi:outer membrane lipoprotein carrier protein
VALEGLEALRSALAGTRDFTAVVEQEKEVSLLRKRIASRGVVRFKRPGLFYMRLDPPHGSVVLLKGGILSIRFPREGVSEEIPLPPEQSLDRWIARLDGPVRSLPDGATVSAVRDGGGGFRLRIVPRDGRGLAEIQVDLSGDGTVTRLSLEEENRDRTVMRFSRVKRNAGIADSDFRAD